MPVRDSHRLLMRRRESLALQPAAHGRSAAAVRTCEADQQELGSKDICISGRPVHLMTILNSECPLDPVGLPLKYPLRPPFVVIVYFYGDVLDRDAATGGSRRNRDFNGKPKGHTARFPFRIRVQTPNYRPKGFFQRHLSHTSSP